MTCSVVFPISERLDEKLYIHGYNWFCHPRELFGHFTWIQSVSELFGHFSNPREARWKGFLREVRWKSSIYMNIIGFVVQENFLIIGFVIKENFLVISTISERLDRKVSLNCICFFNTHKKLLGHRLCHPRELFGYFADPREAKWKASPNRISFFNRQKMCPGRDLQSQSKYRQKEAWNHSHTNIHFLAGWDRMILSDICETPLTGPYYPFPQFPQIAQFCNRVILIGTTIVLAFWLEQRESRYHRPRTLQSEKKVVVLSAKCKAPSD